MAIDFPNSPTAGDVYTVGNRSWTYDGTGWRATTTPSANHLPLAGGTLTGSLVTATPSTSLVALRIPHGAAPTAPTNGDMWTTTAGIFVRANGVTVGPLAAAGAAFPVGAVGTPSVTSTDPDTGMYWPAANNVALATAGVQRLNIDGAGLFTGTGMSMGAMTTYTPTIAGTGWALGNGNVTGSRYLQIGKMVYVNVTVVFGTTSTYGSTLALRVSYPVTPNTSEWSFMTGVAGIGANQYPISAQVEQINGNIKIRHAASPIVDTTATVPATWVAGSGITFTGWYEAA
jgi:hypothetical protein